MSEAKIALTVFAAWLTGAFVTVGYVVTHGGGAELAFFGSVGWPIYWLVKLSVWAWAP